MNYVIFDIDNCISDDSHRIPLIDWTPGISPDERYKAYHDKAYTDRPHNSAALISWLRTPGVQVVFMTARPELIRGETNNWLLQHFDVKIAHLFMRPNSNNEPSVKLKSSMLSTLNANMLEGDVILHAYDDRQDVVDMYNLRGVEASVLKVHDVCAYTPPAECGDLYPVQGARPVVEQEPLPEPEPLCEVCGLSMNAPVCLGAPAKTAGDILEAMAATFRERNAVYGNNYKMVAPLVRALFPNGVPPELVVTDQWHLFELKLVKLSRFAISNLTHMDSIHDDGVYSAMIESILNSKQETGNL